jgi:hypothetical protein
MPPRDIVFYSHSISNNAPGRCVPPSVDPLYGEN